MKPWKLIIVLCILTLCLAGCAGSNRTDSQNKEQSGSGNPLAGQTIKAFQTQNLEGNKVTEDIFKDYDLTMINIWGTFCGPCVEEMPEIGKLRADYAEQGINIIGIVVDQDAEAAREILENSGAGHQNLLPDEVLKQQVVSAFDYVPVTIFVDEQGCVMDEIVSGSNDYEGYKAVIEQIRSRL